MIETMDQQAPSPTQPPGPGPAPYRSPFEAGKRKLRRSRSNRFLGGVAGGLGEYLGVDANSLRVGFVLFSFLFLAGIGGMFLYVLAWVIIPEAGAVTSPLQDAVQGRPWQDWDRSARSWAIVLGSLVLAVIWSFGVGPGLHWRALPALLIVAAVIILLLSRHGPLNPWHNCNGYRGGPGGPPPSSQGGPWPGAQTGGPVPYPPASGPGPYVPDSPGAGPGEASSPTTFAPPAGNDPQDSDWLQAQRAAAGWASEQLAAAGVPSAPPYGATRRIASRRRGHGSGFSVFVIGLVLVCMLAAIGFVLNAGSSLRGGIGYSHYAPSSLSSVDRHYREGIGNLAVDLSAVSFPASGHTVTMSVGIGRLSVVVPASATVSVNATTGIGNVNVFGVSGPNFHRVVRGGPHAPKGGRLTLNLHVGIGSIAVERHH